MSAGLIRTSVVAERIAWVRQMVQGIRSLPMSDYESFVKEAHNVAAAESYLRRALEAVLDLGRHVLAKGFSIVVDEYREIGTKLYEEGVIDENGRLLLRQMAGYRNRMVHFYHEVSKKELYEICTQRLPDIEIVCDGIIDWLKQNPAAMDELFS